LQSGAPRRTAPLARLPPIATSRLSVHASETNKSSVNLTGWACALVGWQSCQECLDNVTRLLSENSRSAFNASGLVFGSMNTANNLKWLLVGFDFERGAQFLRKGGPADHPVSLFLPFGTGGRVCRGCAPAYDKVRVLSSRRIFLPGDGGDEAGGRVPATCARMRVVGPLLQLSPAPGPRRRRSARLCAASTAADWAGGWTSRCRPGPAAFSDAAVPHAVARCRLLN